MRAVLFSCQFCIIFAEYYIFILMKKFILLAILFIVAVTVTAQTAKKSSAVEPQYDKGAVPVLNGKVTFEETIQAEGLSAAQVEERINAWVARRYVKPTVISAKRYDEKPGTVTIKGEEYIVFKSTWIELIRARIYYYLTMEAQDGCCKFKMSRITYWYDDEDDEGGVKMIAENWIPDDKAFKKNGKLKKFEGKFRRKTIDLKNILVNELKETLK